MTTVARAAVAASVMALLCVGCCSAQGCGVLTPGTAVVATGGDCVGSYYRTTYLRPVVVPHIPYRVDSVCVVLINGTSLTPQDSPVSAVVYSAMWDPRLKMLVPRWLLGSTRALQGLVPLSMQSSPVLQEIPVSTVVYERYAFVGVEVPECRSNMQVGTLAAGGERGEFLGAHFARAGTATTWTMFRTDLVVRFSGERLLSPPEGGVPGWRCDPTRYADGKVCDCHCGMEDPDCFYLDRVSPDCSGEKNEVCVGGECEVVGDHCPTRELGNGDVCDCGCSDPDCRSPALVNTTSRCGSAVSPRCSIDTGFRCEDDWTCPSALYGDGKWCNKECGTVDPDCALQLPEYCTATGKVLKDGRCIPGSWSCDLTLYGDGSVCNCNCGTYDPDCDSQRSILHGCDAETPMAMSCQYFGLCVASSCGNVYADPNLNEECDGGLGCSASCTCLPGFRPKSPPRADCAPVCGDNVRVPGEQCDGSQWCNRSLCMCEAGHPLMDQVLGVSFCSGCGNRFREPLTEECDFGIGCSPYCKCSEGFVPSRDKSSIHCDPIAPSSVAVTLLIAAVAVTGGMIVIVAAVGVAVFLLVKWVRTSQSSRQRIPSSAPDPLYTLQSTAGPMTLPHPSEVYSTGVEEAPPPVGPPPDPAMPPILLFPGCGLSLSNQVVLAPEYPSVLPASRS